MAIKNDYSAGTVSVSAGGTVVTGVSSMWVAADIQPGDTFKVKNLDAIILSVDSNTQITIKEAWTGGALTASAYAIRYQPDGSRYSAAARALIEMLGNGNLQALAGLTGALNKIPYFIGAGAMALADFKDWAISFFSLTPAADKLAYFNGSTSAALTDITAQGRTALANITAAGNALIDDTDASAQLSTLGFSTFGKTLIDDADAPTFRTTAFAMGVIREQRFGVSGTYTPHPNMVYCEIMCQGAGGGGAGVTGAGASSTEQGGGGGSGATAFKIASAADIGASKAVTIGAPGAGGGINAAGTDGGSTSVGSLCSAQGGFAGLPSANRVGGAGGGNTGSIAGDYGKSGQQGQPGQQASGPLFPTQGVASFMGGGGTAAFSGAVSGAPAAGAGGAGRHSFNGGNAGGGGGGGIGFVIIKEYCTK